MAEKSYRKYVVDVKDFPKPGIIFKDITPLLEQPKALNEAMYDMQEIIKTLGYFNKLVCADARGFLFGVPMSLAFQVPLVLARKKGKLPRPGESITYNLEYGTNTIELSKDSIQPGDKVVIIDDLLATGGSANAIKSIVERCQASVVGLATLIELDALKGREALKDIQVVACLHF